MNTNWHYTWTCLCGYCFGEGHSSLHLTFGFSKLCPECGASIGSNHINQTIRKTVRWVREIPFKFFNIKSWFGSYYLENKNG